METKFTPGPWSIVDHTTAKGGYLAIHDEANKHVADIFPFRVHINHSKPRAENDANAHLIAAAPVGYAANVEALDFISSHFQNLTTGDWENEEAREVAEQLTAALKKARGE